MTREVAIVFGAHKATVTEAGGGLRSCVLGGRAVLDGYGEHETCSGARGQLLLPWPNRIRGGRYRFGGIEHQLALDEPERGNAIHGLLRSERWDVTGEAHRARATCVLHPQNGYPFTLSMDVSYELVDSGLRVEITAANVGDDPLPYGAGQHPYIAPGTELVDDAILTLPGHSVLDMDANAIPTGRTIPVGGTPLDFRWQRAPSGTSPSTRATPSSSLAREARRG